MVRIVLALVIAMAIVTSAMVSFVFARDATADVHALDRPVSTEALLSAIIARGLALETPLTRRGVMASAIVICPGGKRARMVIDTRTGEVVGLRLLGAIGIARP